MNIKMYGCRISITVCVIGYLCYSATDVIAKHMAETIPVPTIVCILHCMVAFLAIIATIKQTLTGNGGLPLILKEITSKPRILMLPILNGAAILGCYTAMALMPLSVTFSILFLTPLVTAIGGMMITGDRVSPRTIIGLIGAAFGLWLALGAGTAVTIGGLAGAVISVIGASAGNLICRHHKLHPITPILVTTIPISGCLFLFLVVTGGLDSFLSAFSSTSSITLMILFGVLEYVGFLLLSWAAVHVDMRIFAASQFSQAPAVIASDTLFFTAPSPWVMGGLMSTRLSAIGACLPENDSDAHAG